MSSPWSSKGTINPVTGADKKIEHGEGPVKARAEARAMQQQPRNVKLEGAGKHPSLEHQRDLGPEDTLIPDSCPQERGRKHLLPVSLVPHLLPGLTQPVPRLQLSSRSTPAFRYFMLLPQHVRVLSLHILSPAALSAWNPPLKALWGSKQRKEAWGPIPGASVSPPAHHPPLIPQRI